MTTLSEFISTADADDATALTQARAFSEQVLKPVDSRMANERTVMGLIGLVSGEAFMQALEAIPIEKLPSRVKAWFKPSEDGIDIVSSEAISLIDTTVSDGTITADEAAVLKGYAYDTSTPFVNATLYDLLKARSKCPKSTVVVQGAYAVINVTANCEAHNPQLHALNPRTGKSQRINGFQGVGLAGLYDALIPPEWRNSALSVDDAYGVVEGV